GGIVGRIAGERARNTLIRFCIGLPYVVRNPPKWCTVREQSIAGVKCRIYVPQASHLKSKGLLVFMHGGGWCVLRPSHYDGAVYSTIKRVGVVAISVDYRRAPEARFPAAIDDCEAVVKAVYEKE
ncbi:aryl-acylamidase, partial [Aphelenchoides avenae]